MSKKNGKYGSETFFSALSREFQNLSRLILFSLVLGLLAALVWWGIFAPKESFSAVNHYWYSWAYCHVPLGCSANSSYNLYVLKPTIDLLGGLFKACTNVFVITSAASVFGLRWYFNKRTNNASEEQYIRGAKLLSPVALNDRINTEKRNDGKLKYQEKPFDLKIGREKIRIPEALSYLHLGMGGASGTGKTQAISSLLTQLARMRGQKCFIVDLNGQYYSKFGRPGDKILSLYDQRTEAWSFWHESVPPEFFAEALVELNESGNNKFFSSAGRALLTDLISLNNNVNELWKDLTTKPSELLPKLDGGISPGLLGASEQAAGVIANASVEMNFLRHLNYWNQSEDFFSVTKWARSQDEEWVFLIVKDIDLSAAKPLLRLWFDLAVGGLLQREEKGNYPHVWLVCDELPGLGKLPSLGKLLSQGRKYRSSVIAGYQVRGQLRDLYGKEGAEELFGGLQTKLIFRTPDPNSSKEESSTLGEQDIEELTSSTQIGVVSSDKSSLNRSIKTRPVVLPSEIQNLPDLQCYLKICYFDPAHIHFVYQEYPALNQPTQCEIPTVTPSSSNHTQLNPEPEPDWDFDPDEIEVEHNFLNFENAKGSEE